MITLSMNMRGNDELSFVDVGVDIDCPYSRRR